MGLENKFGKWGAWVAAAGIAIGSGHEMLKDDENKKPITEIIKKSDTVADDTEENIDVLPIENKPNPKDTEMTLQKTTDQIKKQMEEEKKKAGLFLNRVNQQIKFKMTPEECKRWRQKWAGDLFDEEEWQKEQEDEKETRQRTDEYAREHHNFDKIKKILENEFPNAFISTKADPEGAFHLQQNIYYTDEDNPDHVEITTFYISFDLDGEALIVSNSHDPRFTEWSASDAQSFVEMFNKQIQAELLGVKLDQIHSSPTNLNTLLKSHGLFEKYQEVLRDNQQNYNTDESLN